jgi:hypothetical protein
MKKSYTSVQALSGVNEVITQLTEKAAEARSGNWAGPEVARLYVELRSFYDLLGACNKELSALKDKMAYEDVPTAFEREGVTTYTLKEGYRVTTSPLVRASCKDMEECIKWMKSHEQFVGIVKETINASTLAALAKGEMGEGRELPDELFNVHVGMNTSVTKIGGK